ncbi:uroporphyrinogen decarboxylase [Muricomes intestini]|uniref:Uroporphyrinogen decarboxylase n=1 Tax=Muricomes intestini TaxID=1796634 RepID=A0A4V2UR94_9FIRM|nr:uroporphyrinogen decarboxylase family protein [Muricomes intestini]TCS76402.1 uroporphyrinogen decarboxylase [Muricomes intestini]
MLTNRERERQTLNFMKPEDRGSVEETFYPWVLTTTRFKEEGMPEEIAEGAKDITNDLVGNKENQAEKYLPVSWGAGVMEYEKYLGFDAVRRVHFVLPFRRFEEKVIEDVPEHVIKQDIYGRQVIQKAGSDLELNYKPVIETGEDWEALKEHARKELEIYYTDELLEEAYGHLQEAHERGDYSIRLNVEGFFWVPRELMGVEQHMYAFYDEPEMMKDINDFIYEVYCTKLLKVIDRIQPDVVYIMEDLSGKNGPMISGDCFEEFLAPYYRKIIALFKEHGVGNVFVDTDGDFAQLIPNFMESGVDGFLPMDVNAGMDIVKVREQFPTLKFIGSFNKLEIANGKEAIDREFERILPVIRGGGYIPGSDHQVAPSTSLEDYKYYISRLKEAMKQCGADL